MGQAYADRNKTVGVDISDKNEKEKIGLIVSTCIFEYWEKIWWTSSEIILEKETVKALRLENYVKYVKKNMTVSMDLEDSALKNVVELEISLIHKG